MKTVAGHTLNSTPLSIYKAASVLSAFVSVETGASHAVSTYLKRVSDSLNDSVQFSMDRGNGGRKKTKKSKQRMVLSDDGDVIDAEQQSDVKKRRRA